jgi:hypothetical protein
MFGVAHRHLAAAPSRDHLTQPEQLEGRTGVLNCEQACEYAGDVCPAPLV